jgi:histidine ammonia-lyase
VSARHDVSASEIVIGEAPLTIEQVVAAARAGARLRLGDAARERVARAAAVIAQIVADERVVYGVTTGFGQLATTHIPIDQVRQLQANLVRSHSAGVGEPLPREVVRAAMAIRVNALAKGHSGVRVEVVELLCRMLELDLIPRIPSRGSLGASGDLAPSAHLVLALMGEGEFLGPAGEALPAGPVLAEAGIEPLVLEAKEGLALLNGTQFMAAIGCLAVADGEALLDSADLIGAMSIEGLRASVGPFQERIQLLRPVPGQLLTAANVRRATESSGIMISHLECDKVQDAYSIRCIPQVHGACRDAFRWLREVIAVEIESVTDNPLVFPDTGDVISAGNFHGEPLALALDLAAMAFSEIGAMSERRVFRMLTTSLSELPPYLTTDSGLNSGYMIAQYTAAALVAENRVLCHPASVDSIPTSGDQEDHVSMGMTAALKLLPVLRNTQTILGIEALCATQAIDLLAPLRPGVGTARAYDVVRRLAPRLERDRALAPEIEHAAQAVADGAFADVMRVLRDERAAGDDERTGPSAPFRLDETPGQATRHEQA